MSAYDDELLDEEEEMPLTERDLADDAQWKIIQKNTFTRWANEHLKTVNKTLNDLESDLSDGLRLVALVEVLSGKKFKTVNRRPNFRTQKLENVTMALEFLERDEGIRIVNIDSGDIVDCKLKLILGLIWTLILHYSISMPMWEGEEPQPQEGGPTPKQRLLNWIQGKVPDLPIKNFTTDWNDGKAIGALVDAIAPGLCPDWEDWDPKKAKQNAKEAMDAAEKWLDVPQLIKPEEMTNPKVDDLSMMTYLSQFPQAKLKPGAPIRPKVNAGRVRAYGPGIEPKGNSVGAPAKFTVETFSAGKGNLEVLVLDPKGKQAKCDSVFNNDRNMTYSCQYVPAMEGEYRVLIKWSDKEIAKSPFKVMVEGAAGDASKVTAAGPGLEKTGVTVQKKTYFEVFTKGPPSKGRLPTSKIGGVDAGRGTVEVTILDPSGHRDKVKPTIQPVNKDGVVLVEYTPIEMGLHSINISFSGTAIPKSPYGVNVGPAINPKAVYATGRGIQPRGVRVKQNAEFKVHTKDAGVAEVKVQIIGPGGANVPCKVVPSKTEEGVFECVYIPPKVGQYVINITFGGQHITKSPFRVDVGPEKFSKVVAFGPGLEGGHVNQPACFTVETNGEVGALGFSIEGPSQAKIDCKDNGDGSADVTYWPTAPGEYAVHILCNDEDIPQAPYMAQIQPATNAFDASKVTAKGPGLEKDGVTVNKPAEFTVDARKAGKAQLNIQCIDANYKSVEVVVKDNRDGTFSCSYNPKTPCKHTIIITWGGVSIPKSPFRVNVTEAVKPGNVKVYGPGIERGVKTFIKTHFTVDCRSAGPGDVAIALLDDRGQDVPCKTVCNKDGTFTIEYEPKTPGVYTVQVYFAGKEVPQSPIKVNVESSIDLSKVTVRGLETPIKITETRTICVVLTLVENQDAPCTVVIEMPSGKRLELTMIRVIEGYTAVFTPTELGIHKFYVTYAEYSIPHSPFSVEVEVVIEMTKVQVRGLESPITVGETRKLTIVTTQEKKRDLPCKVTVKCPSGKLIQLTALKKVPDGYDVDFKPTEEGLHKVEVVYDKRPAEKSPFDAFVIPRGPRVEVLGLEKPIEVGENRPLQIVTKSMPKKDGPCMVVVKTPVGKILELPLKKTPDGYSTALKPTEPGDHLVAVDYEKKPIPTSPHTAEVVPRGGKPLQMPGKDDLTGDVVVKGLDTPINTGEKRTIIVDVTSVSKKDGPCIITTINPKGRSSNLKTKPCKEGFEAVFSPWDSGIHKVKVEYAGKEAPGSPFSVEVIKINYAAITVKGLEKPIPLGQTRKISIITKDCGKSDLPCVVTVLNPRGQPTDLPTKKTPEGYECDFTPEEAGQFKVKVEYAAKEVPKSPFTVTVEMTEGKTPGKTAKPAEETPLSPDKIQPSKSAPSKSAPGAGGITVKGLETPVGPGEKRQVIIVTTAAPKKDAPCKVTMVTPKNRSTELKTKPNPEGYETVFSSWDKGMHTVKVEYDGKEIPDSPFQVMVEKIDVTKVTVKGLETPIPLGESRKVTVLTHLTDRPDAPCSVVSTSPSGTTEEIPTQQTPEGYEFTFTPKEKGDYKVKVTFAGKEVPGSPFPVNVSVVDISGVVVKGLEKPVMLTERRKISIITTATGKKDLPCQVFVTNPKGATLEVLPTKAPDGHEAMFVPSEIGLHKVKILVAGQEVPGSEFKVNVTKFEERVEVTGLDTPMATGEKRDIGIKVMTAAKPNKFGPQPSCKVTVQNPKGRSFEPKVDKTSTGFSTFYSSNEPGPHVFKIEYNGKEIPDSPITCEVEKLDLRKVDVKGLETPIEVGEKRPVQVITDTCGKPDAPCKVTDIGPKGDEKDLPTKKIPEGFETLYAPLEVGPHKIKVEYAGKELPKSPFPVEVKPKGKETPVKVKGLETPVQVGEKRPISVETAKADQPCKVSSSVPKGKPTDLPVKKTPKGFEAIFAPLEEGPHLVKVEYPAGKEVAGSPFPVNVEPAPKVTVKGLETPIKVGEKRPISVETPKADQPCKVSSSVPKGKPTDLPVKKTPKGFEAIFAPLEEGPHLVKVEYPAGKEVAGSPFPVNVEPAPKVTVKGLETPIKPNEKRKIEVLTPETKTPNAPCKVTAVSPTGKPTNLPTKKTKDGYEATFAPVEVGPHLVHVNFDNKELPDSPFTANMDTEIDLGKVDVKGLEKPVEVDEERPISIITKDTINESAPCKVTALTPEGRTIFLNTKKVPGGYESMFNPKTVGPFKINVEVNGKEVPKSPLSVNVEPKLDIKKLEVKGLEKPIKVGEARPITVVTAPTGKPDLPCRVLAKGPTTPYQELPVKKVNDGYEAVYQPKEAGANSVKVEYNGKEVPKSPYHVAVESDADVSKVQIKGLETPIEVREPRTVSIDTRSTTCPSAPCIATVMTPKGQVFQLPTEPAPEGYRAVFAPVEPGPHQIGVNFAGENIPQSPIPVKVEPRANVGAVVVRGLETPIEVGENRPVFVDTKSTGKPDAPCKVSVTAPNGKTAELPTKAAPEGYETLFAPLEAGPHKVNVEFAGQPVPDSPFNVDVQPPADVTKVTVSGLDTPVQVGEQRPVQVFTGMTGKPDAPCRAVVTNPRGQKMEMPLQKTPEGYQTLFAPLEPGPHMVNVNFANKEVPKSPFSVDVVPAVDIGAVEVFGLETPIKVGEPRPITVMTSTTGKPDAPCSVKVMNPQGQVKELPTKKIPEGYTATLAPSEVGPHQVAVEFNGQEVPKSPFNVMAEPAIDFSKVKVNGLEQPVEVGEIRPVKIDTAETGVVDAPCQVTATNPAGQVRELPMQKTPRGYEAQFAPLETGPHQVAVKYAGKEVPKSPFKVDAIPQGPPASKVKAYGPGLDGGLAETPCKFTIDTREVTQPGGIGVTVEGPAESKIECRDNQDGTCDVTYYPEVPGEYTINVTYADEHIPNSPFKPKIAPSGKIDVSKVKAYGPGLEPGVFLDSPTGFTVDASSVAPTGEGKIRAIVTSPSGQRTESLVKNNNDGTYDVLYTPYEQGPNTLDITYENIPIPQSPVKVNATPGCDASRVKAYGPGLEGGNTNDKQVFTVDVKGAGQGGLALAIDGPAETQINCKDNRDGTCEVEYLPVKKGDYDITVKFADQHIPGSPFKVGIKDEVNPNKVRCYGPGLEPKNVKANKPATFTVDTKEAGEAPLDVTYTGPNGQPQPADIVPVAEDKFECTYYPTEEAKCKIDVNYAGRPVPNSPFNIAVQPGSPADKVRVTGEGIQPTVLASVPVQFVIDTRDAPKPADVDVVIERPDGTFIRPAMQDNGDGTYTVQYTPEDCGPYNISVTYGGEPVPGVPFKTTAIPTGDASKCKITDGRQPYIPVEKETVITVDASEAGTGKVTCRIRSPTGAEIDIDIVENTDGTFNILFTPSFPGDYSISIKFGGQAVPDGEYVLQALDDSAWQDYLLKNPPVGEEQIVQDQVDATQAAAPGSGLYQPQEFRIPVGPIFNFVTAYVTMPSGKKAYPKIDDNKDGTVTVRYQPQETGLHELHVCYNQQEIPGSPFQFHVDAVNSGFVTAYGPGLSHGVVNVPAQFTIVTKDAGAGGLSLAIEGPSKTEIKCQDNEDGTCTVTYVPTAPGEYNITVKFADKNISGSPFIAKITAGEPKQRAQIGRSSEVSLKVTETDITNLTASIRSPSGQEEPCMLKRLPNGHLGISFTPREVGEHLVNVYRNGQHIANSPFKITVGETELGNAGKVKVYGKGLEEGMANEVNEFIVDTREAGYGGLSLSIEGPSKADIECHDNEDGTCRVTYKPTEPGTYIINIKFADEHVPGSPYKVKIGGEPSERITERIMRHRDAVDVSHVGSECELSLKIPGTSPFDMTASVTSPSGVTELCDVVSLDDCHYSIKFVPKEMGIHTVSVKHKDMHIPGSPFQFTVGPIAGGGAHKVHAAGLGLVRGEVNQPNEFNIYTREAGAGGLSIAVEGPSKAEVDFEDRKDGSCGVTYNVSEPGEYLVSIKFNDEHIPESPFRVPITPSIGDARKISVSALQSKGLAIGKPCSFVVNFNGAPKGKLQARVVSPSGTEEEALVQEIDDGEYAVRFIPRENGPHLVYVSFDGCQIKDSPFRIQVGSVHADPGMVQAYGDGLKTGKTDKTSKFIVNTVNAGSGALSVTVEGPSKVKLECREVEDGYEFSYTPTAPGDYFITIKYAGTNIAGSPYKARVEGQGKPTGFQEQTSVVVETVTKTSSMSKFASFAPFSGDASKVTVEGSGLKRGYRNKQCSFNVDASQAGNQMLFIGMIGPKGPCEELCVKHYPGQPYKITYLVKERGDYMLAIKWGEEHIPGSPFYVKVE